MSHRNTTLPELCNVFAFNSPLTNRFFSGNSKCLWSTFSRLSQHTCVWSGTSLFWEHSSSRTARHWRGFKLLAIVKLTVSWCSSTAPFLVLYHIVSRWMIQWLVFNSPGPSCIVQPQSLTDSLTLRVDLCEHSLLWHLASSVASHVCPDPCTCPCLSLYSAVLCCIFQQVYQLCDWTDTPPPICLEIICFQSLKD